MSDYSLRAQSAEYTLTDLQISRTKPIRGKAVWSGVCTHGSARIEREGPTRDSVVSALLDARRWLATSQCAVSDGIALTPTDRPGQWALENVGMGRGESNLFSPLPHRSSLQDALRYVIEVWGNGHRFGKWAQGKLLELGGTHV